ncbi:carboxylesterase family protein [Ruminococcaceae bacterium OttesenSCG-928-L11]|nr:carboxylesterase family protein [Ruminococcaceae bacterium OttesenSCG-928-L11]
MLGIVSTKFGQLKGVCKQDYTVFRGVPYAKPPVGDLRWKAPVEPDCWDGVRQADRFGTRCMSTVQEPGAFYYKEFFADEDYIPAMSEDGLYLNVWTPAESGEERLPVAFWIHGGAFSGGFGTELEFDGEAFCRQGVILVTINYRLGALGFLAHPELSAEDPDGHSGNYGILDQIAALKWVYENIAAFGGDPGRITVFGQSAGAMSVQTLVSSPLTRGMIAGAILQSGGGYQSLSRDVTLKEMQEIGAGFLAHCGVSSVRELREMDSETISRFSNEYFVECARKGIGGLPFVPCIDGYVLHSGYNAAIESGDIADIPYMLGSTKNDVGATPENPETGPGSMLYEGCINWSRYLEKLGRAPAHVYWFTRAPLGDDAGAFHSAELWYVFGTLHRSWRPKTEADYALSRQMVAHWCSFVKTGNPNGDSLPQWKPCTEQDPFVLELS